MTSETLETIIRQWKNNCIEILEHVGSPAIYDSVLTKETSRLVAAIKSHESQIKREVIEKVKQALKARQEMSHSMETNIL
jgi:D-aminopeptidase